MINKYKRKPILVEKGWGHEIWIANEEFCGKILNYKKSGAISSVHFHGKKREHFYCLSGRFKITILNTSTIEEEVFGFEPGELIFLKPLTPHSVECLEPGLILEVSTYHSDADVYRIAKGDSQK